MDGLSVAQPVVDFAGDAVLPVHPHAEIGAVEEIASFAIAGHRPPRRVHIAEALEAVAVGVFPEIRQHFLRVLRVFRYFFAHVVQQRKAAFQRQPEHGRVLACCFDHLRVRSVFQPPADMAAVETDAGKNQGDQQQQTRPQQPIVLRAPRRPIPFPSLHGFPILQYASALSASPRRSNVFVYFTIYFKTWQPHKRILRETAVNSAPSRRTAAFPARRSGRSPSEY